MEINHFQPFSTVSVKPQDYSRILGLDPGLNCTGWGIVDKEGFRIKYIACGVIKTGASQDLSIRLSKIFHELTEIVDQYQPDTAVVEETFINKNPASALKLGMARGVILMAPSYKGLPVFSYTANQVKKSVVGAGHADKDQVAAMIRVLLPTAPTKLLPDATDALAVALCHGHQIKIRIS
ncbi:MAG: crossover junction endodeoxyribonuclease RuvC [Candidatus Puniceispirillum sp.]|nr:crossover junction endodeoxyribonuclease RuvC [Candidatus Pelagibacter sp.]MBA4282850.1 crossover junction endodeoxyribonuclease RuvC [Candidatus Puniceispirillum sp.]